MAAPYSLCPRGVRHLSGFSSRWVATAGVSIRMVRNFGILNVVLCIPTLFDQNKAGPFEVSFTINAMKSIGMLRKINKIIAIKRSKMRFIYFLTFLRKRESLWKVLYRRCYIVPFRRISSTVSFQPVARSYRGTKPSSL